MARTWTDPELRAAVADSRSWRAVARALGLKGTSAGSIRVLKRRVKHLGLDTAHFTQQRTWSDRELRDAVTRSGSWAEVIRELNLSDSGAGVRMRIKGHAVRLGLDLAHLEKRTTDNALSLPELTPDYSLLSKGAELFASSWFTVRGALVAAPTQPAAYDLLVVFGDGFQRVQVKSTTCRDRYGSWVVNIGRRPYVLDKSASRMPYDPNDLDYFFVIDGEGVVYLIPASVVAGRTSIGLGAYKAYRVGDASSLFARPPYADARAPRN